MSWRAGRGCGSYEAIPREPPALPITTGRVAGAAAFGGGSGELWIDDCRCCGTEPVTSFEGAWFDEVRERKNLSDSKRWVSALQLTAATEIDASTARRNKRSERPGSTTRIGFPTHTQQDKKGVNNARVNKRLSWQDSFNPNRSI
jgi:hypothetical protein